MTTVQEAPMDSPTIPGRPPLHERSISAPGDWRENGLTSATLLRRQGQTPLLEESPTLMESNDYTFQAENLSSAGRTFSPPGLSRLIIPSGQQEPIEQLRSRSKENVAQHDDSDDKPPAPPPKSPRMEGRISPNPKGSMTPSTPANMSTISLPSANSLGTPGSAPGEFAPGGLIGTPNSNKSPARFQRELPDGYRTDYGSPSRQQKEPTGSPVLNRGRPHNRNNSNLQISISDTTQRSSSSEKKAFRNLPSGTTAVNVPAKMASSEIQSLQRQAYGQAAKFEVLSLKDVESLSRELRALDERCEYLRRTLVSLRSGRRGLHGRMVSYLKSPRIANFSRESLIKQEEALAELDISIDDWVSKLEHAENRQARIRQKVLEHVAATLTVKSPDDVSLTFSGEESPTKSPERPSTPVRLIRRDVESIKIYADSNVYTLLEDVDQEISKMVDLYGGFDDSPVKSDMGLRGKTEEEGGDVLLLPKRYQA
ncbi:MAG: hypothetical protein M1833_006649 [Piccolia ochrophora]|nr:MAG: hypothetical protein M1833_006649 [Piccolia ochrophora]